MKIAIVLFNVDLHEFDLSDYYLIGVDRGALNLVQNNYQIDYSIGDFDSVSKEELNLIKQNSKEICVLNPIKDKTDSEEALDKALTLSKDITIFGGIKGKRIEHFLSILTLFKRYPDLKIIDNNSLIMCSNNMQFSTFEYKDYKFISFFTIEPTHITLKGFKYDLDNFSLSLDNCSLTTSNEIQSDEAFLKSDKNLLIVLSKSEN